MPSTCLMSRLPYGDEPAPLSWTSNELNLAFPNSSVAIEFASLEEKWNVIDEIDAFAALVNMSTVASQPFQRWVRYREGYSGQLVKQVLNRYPINAETEFVLDPMCGSGSTLVACQQEGLHSLGLDVNGYAVLASNVKCHPYTGQQLSEIKSKTSELDHAQVRVGEVERSVISDYFPPQNYAELCSLRAFVGSIEDECVRDFFKLALIAIVEDCSNRRKDGNGLATRPSPITDVLRRFRRQIEIMFNDIQDRGPVRARCEALEHSALSLTKPCQEFSSQTGRTLGSIVFSPPYANSFDYFESYKMELLFGRFISESEFKTARSRLIRNFRISRPQTELNKFELVELLCDEVLRRVPEKERETGVRDGRTRLVPNMLRAYFHDMRIVLEEAFCALSDGGMIHIVVDQSAYVGVPIPTDLILAQQAEEIGFKVDAVAVCRRAATSGQQLKRHPYLRQLLRESIVSLRK